MPLEHAFVTTHARAWIKCGQMRACSRTNTNTNTHTKKKTRAAVPPTCCFKEQTSPPVTITGPDLCHKRQEGPDPPVPSGLVRNPQVSQRREGEKWRSGVTGQNSPSGSEPWTDERCSSSSRLSELCDASESRFSWSEPGCSISGSRHAKSSLRWRMDIMSLAKGCFTVKSREHNYEGRRSSLFLLDGLDSFHQVLLSFCVRVQRLFLRDHTELGGRFLVHLTQIVHILRNVVLSFT